MYKKVDAKLDFLAREKEVLDFWKKDKTFEKVNEKNKNGQPFTFYDGPPTANGKPHVGHVLTRVIKDIIPRYKSMKGYNVLRKAGWDTHGLPVEIEVEKLLGLDGKQDIEKYGVEPFIEKCKESVWKYKGMWEDFSEKVGYWVDMENPYVTYEDNYIESVWWALKEMGKKDLIYKGHKIMPYCPRCGTALSSHEVAQGYKDVKEKSVIAKFKLIERKNTYFLAWTTTPWTLPSNVALCFNPKEKYVELKMLKDAENGESFKAGEVLILAENLISKFFAEDEYQVISTKTGKEYEFTAYEPLFDFAKPKKKAFYATCDNYVTLEDGTGIVHLAPAFGMEDAEVGRKYDLPFVQMVNDRGEFIEGCGEYTGVFAKDADKMVLKDLRISGKMFKDLMYEHSYPHCWRCDTPLLYYARDSWFIKTTKVKENIIKNNQSVNWLPENIKNGRMGKWLDNMVDWAISRNRYWGTPLPIWVCEDGHVHIVGSKQELKELSGKEVKELHKPYVDEVTFACPDCGKPMKRTDEVLDCWFDSGSMPFAQFHYPFENKEEFEKYFPAAFISEGVDQTRGWFYTLLVIGTVLFDKSPFETCISLAHVNDKDGRKMSKSIGNVIAPDDVLEKQGADAIRWYFYTNSEPWMSTKLSLESVSEVQRKFMGTLWNTYAFFVLYADIDKFNPNKQTIDDCKLSMMDKWVISKLNTLVEEVSDGLENYDISNSARKIQDFVDELSNWYVRRSRERFWVSGQTEDKTAAFTTLHTVLVTLSKLLAPFTPFMAETIYDNLVKNQDKNAPASVHMCEYPVADHKYHDEELEKGMQDVLTVSKLARASRNASKIKNRQPLAKLLINSVNGFNLSKELIELIKEELNVEKVEVVENATEYLSYNLKPQLKILGPKYGRYIGNIKKYLSELEPVEAVTKLKAGEALSFELNGETVKLALEDVLIEAKNKEGFFAESDGNITAILDAELTPELLDKGLVRELVSKIQALRKSSGFEVTNHINVSYFGNDKMQEVIEKYYKDITKDVLADSMKLKEVEDMQEMEINEHKMMIAIKKVKRNNKDLRIAFEDNHILVVEKPQNVPVQEDASKDKDMLTMCKEYIKEKYNKPGNVYLGLVHRLDRPTGGIMVFAKTSKAASRLSEAWKKGEVEKHYLASLVGTPRDENNTLVNYLKKDTKNNIVSVVPMSEEGAKYAELSYKVLQANSKLSLVDVALKTGRSHQIRVQFSNIKNPVFGDIKYKGDIVRGYNLALWSYKLRFTHPVTKKIMCFISYPPMEDTPWKYFNILKHVKIK